MAGRHSPCDSLWPRTSYHISSSLAIALYPGSFDPVSKGHVDVTERAAALFDEAVVAIYDAPLKHLLFTTKERVELMRKGLSHLPYVRSCSCMEIRHGAFCTGTSSGR